MKFVDVFRGDLGYASVLTHSIDTGTACPIQQHPRHLPDAFREEVHSQVTDMLHKELFNPALAQWLPQLFLSRKRMEVSFLCGLSQIKCGNEERHPSFTQG